MGVTGGKGLRIEFLFVPYPQEIFQRGIDLSRSAYKLLGYLLYHTVRLGRPVVFISDDEILHGRHGPSGARLDAGSTIGGRNNLKAARGELVQLGWIETERNGLTWRYRVVLYEGEQVSETDTSEKCPKRTPEVSDSDSPLSEMDAKASETDKRNKGNGRAKSLEVRKKEKKHHAFGALKRESVEAWLRIKQAMREQVGAEEWELWVRPARLLRILSGSVMMVAVPPSGAIMAAAAKRKQLLWKVARETENYAIALTVYPDEWQTAEAARRHPELLGTEAR